MKILDLDNKLSNDSIVNIGNGLQIKNVMEKALRKEPITLGYIGGSITEGAGASLRCYNYASQVTKWWKNKYPDTEIKYVNAGIGATGSITGVHRVEKDLLSYKPDFVIVEFAVNDEELPIIASVYESLIRRIMFSENKPGVMLVFTMRNDGSNLQEIHKKIGFKYNLPMVSFKDALWPQVAAKKILWEDFESDIVHPNDTGHYLISKFITDRLQVIYESKTASNIITNIIDDSTIAKRTQYEDATILFADQITPVSYGDWYISRQTHVFGPGWISIEGDDPLVFDINAENIGVIYKKYNTSNMGKAKISIDKINPFIVDSYFPVDWGGYACSQIFGENLGKGIHRLEISRCKRSGVNMADEEFMICGILVSGRT